MSPPSDLTLGIETSCDETSIALLEGRSTLLANVISSQLAQHAPFGGVVPELAARAHVENLPAVLEAALDQAGVRLEQVDRIGVTSGPGLVGALLVGAGYAKGLALGLGKPLYPVNHLQAHVFANLLEQPGLEPPFLALVISGGHTVLARVESWESYRVVGETRDDAAGEAFDKVAKLLGLGYPGGPVVEKLAREGDPRAIAFPRPMASDSSFDFSFSGLKTAVANEVRASQEILDRGRIADVCASFQAAVIDSLAAKTFRAADERPTSAVVLAGGVSRNHALRERFAREAAGRGLALCLPSPELCTDNAAMVARAAHHLAARGVRPDLGFDVRPSLRLEEPA
ncbi:MAG: tRNA (adenosine(37)-N6)-threonylcarbamoyltransferase complex transferase subunit TsaD [Gemmatimonadota bacterium]